MVAEYHKNIFAMILPYFISCAFVQPPLWEGVKVETRWLYLTARGFPFFWATLKYSTGNTRQPSL